jgi:PAS domain S-box-containing protein
MDVDAARNQQGRGDDNPAGGAAAADDVVNRAPPDQEEAQVVMNVISEEVADHPSILALQATNQTFLLTDPRQAGNPIVFCSRGFLEMTGYPQERIIGRNCRFMQGPNTDPVAVSKLRAAIDNEQDIKIVLLNYRMDDSTFWNHIIISNIRDGQGNVIYFLGLSFEISERDPLLVTG